MCPRGHSRHLWARPHPLSTVCSRASALTPSPKPGSAAHLSRPPREGREAHPAPSDTSASARGDGVVGGLSPALLSCQGLAPPGTPAGPGGGRGQPRGLVLSLPEPKSQSTSLRGPQVFRKVLEFPEHCPHPCQPGWLCGPRARSSFPHRSWPESGGLRTAGVPGSRSIREASGQVALSCPTYQGEGASVGAGAYPGPQPQAGVPPTGQGVGFGSYALAVTLPGEGGTMDVCTVTLGDGLTGQRAHRGTHAPSSAPSPCTPGPTMCREPSQTLKVWGG